MRKSTLFRTGAIVALSIAATTAASATSFSDVSGNRNETAIHFLNANSVVDGYSNGTFRPNIIINRAELAKVLVTAVNESPQVDQYHDCFSDVGTEWYAPYVCFAKEKGWVSGNSDGSYRPSDPVNTADAIKMILNAQGIVISTTSSSNTFSDVNFNAWYSAYVETANGKGLLQNENGKLGIGDNITRGTVAEMLYRALFIRALGVNKFDASIEPGNPDNTGITADYKQSLQQYLVQANAASDKTMLTKDQFSAALLNRIGSGPQELLTSATTFVKYTDPLGNEIILGLDANGTVVFKRPGGFGGGFGNGMIAQELGITTDQLNAELQSGKTIQQVAQEHGVILPFPMGNHGDWIQQSNDSSSSLVACTNASFTWRGRWNSTTTYSVNDVVIDAGNGNAYVEVQGNNTGTEPLSNSSWWQPLSQCSYAIWNSETRYYADDVVIDPNNGYTPYVAVNASLNTPPYSNNSLWQTLSNALSNSSSSQ